MGYVNFNSTSVWNFEKPQLNRCTDTFNTYVHRVKKNHWGFNNITLSGWFFWVFFLLQWKLFWQCLHSATEPAVAASGWHQIKSDGINFQHRLGRNTWKGTLQKRPEGRGGHQVDHEAAWARSASSGSQFGEVMLPHHSELGKPHLHCWVQSQAPQHKTDVDLQEQVQ